MKRIDLKNEIRGVLRSDWSAFAASHPRLAEVIDQELLIESIAAELSRSDEFQRALAEARGLASAAELIAPHVRRFVREALHAIGW
jgi:hypothetical protein